MSGTNDATDADKFAIFAVPATFRQRSPASKYFTSRATFLSFLPERVSMILAAREVGK